MRTLKRDEALKVLENNKLWPETIDGEFVALKFYSFVDGQEYRLRKKQYSESFEVVGPDKPPVETKWRLVGTTTDGSKIRALFGDRYVAEAFARTIEWTEHKIEEIEVPVYNQSCGMPTPSIPATQALDDIPF